MTAKDKANELIELFYQNAPETMRTGRALEFGGKMALIMVEQILESQPSFKYWETYDDETPSAITFWNEVKTELNNII